MKKIAEEAIKLLQNGTDFVQATILTSSGSTPREAGAVMLIRADGSIVGTVGGGVLEAHIMKTGLSVLKSGKSIVDEYVLEQSGAAAIGAICGGRATVLIERIDPADELNLAYFEQLLEAVRLDRQSYNAVLIPDSGEFPVRSECLLLPDGTVACAERFDPDIISKLQQLEDIDEEPVQLSGCTAYLFPVGSNGTVFIFGAGHCGEKLAHVLHTVSFGTVVLDDRSEFANAVRFPEADEILVPDSMEQPFNSIEFGADSYIVIVTRGHMYDELILKKALQTRAGYIGMIGSRKKRETIYQHLLSDGFTDADIARVHSPIGLSIGAETPEEIAVSIAAELIKFRAGKKV